MSGGSLDYFYCQLQEHVGDFKDKELDELVSDLADLFHAREWYLSCDYGEGQWNEARDKFKQKWFSEGARAERIEKYLADKYCKDCKNWAVESENYGKCKFAQGYLNHRCDTCEKWEAKDGTRS